jgi:hypothetical protein
MLKNLQLNNFANAAMSGWLELFTTNFFGQVRWENKFCVLCNIGLLYWTDVLKSPNDLFPVLDCVMSKLAPGDSHFTEGYFSFRLIYSRKTVILRCLSNP